MKRFTLLLALFSCGFGLGAPQQGQTSLDDIVLPRKSEIYISLHRAINSKTAQPGDKFSAVVEVPVTLSDQIVIPVGSFVLGHIASAQEAGYLRGKARLQLAFDTVILPEGVTRRMVAMVESADKYQTDPASEDGTLKTQDSKGEDVAVGAAKGAVTGMITGATIGMIRGGTARGLGIGSAVGAAGGALLAMLKRGDDVELPRGSSLTIQLQEPVRFARPEPTPSGVPLGP